MSQHSPTDQPPRPADTDLTIVGIGASAGGLQALRTFFGHVPEDSGLAFVVVVHLAPDHESHLANLLQPSIAMPVQQVTKTVPLEANQVYVIPPNQNLDTIDTHLRLTKLEEKRSERAPIDHFFRTLAQVHDGHSVGIILTGTGSDGTLGIKEVKSNGGLTVVQDPNEAEYDGMPQSAIATGLIDRVLPLAQIPAYVIRFANTRPRVVVPDEAQETNLPGDEEQLLQKVFVQIKNRTGRDFGRYKRSTIMRRLRRRMQLTQLEELADYLDHLRRDGQEVKALSDDFLITVTNFFRDAEVYEELQDKVVPRLFEDRGSDQHVRVWSVGCSTGEEAYSLAMLLLEEAARQEAPPQLQIFASDLHDASLAKGREGFYPGDITTDVSPERLRRFFVKEESGYRIRKEVRDLVVFAPHNLLGDPPFSKIDLIVCRNVLIYLQRAVQRDVIELFHYALLPGGYLTLGTSETIERSELFSTENKTHCLFRRRNVPAPELSLPVFPVANARPVGQPANQKRGTEPVAYGALHQRIVERYAPPSLLVSPDYNVVHFSEHVGRYLVHPGGEATSNVFKLVRPDFHIELRTALHTAREKEESVYTKPVAVYLEGAARQVTLSVLPATDAPPEDFFVIIFDEQDAEAIPQKQLPAADTDSAGPGDTVRELEGELDLTKQRLQAIIEEYETSQEEMKASNEEMQSTNEELRSTMEELETSKEELQSMNEELSTLNQENRHKVEELSQLSGDLQNLLSATDIATLFLDRQLRIMRFTPRISELFNVRQHDRGRPLSDLTHRLGYDDLQHDAQRVLDKLIPVEREVQDEAGHWYLTRVLPYRSNDDRIEGVVITFVDITERRRSEEALQHSEEFHRRAIEASQVGTWEVNLDTGDCSISPQMAELMGYAPEPLTGSGADKRLVVSRQRWMNSVHPDDRAALEEAMVATAEAKETFSLEFRVQLPNRQVRWLYSKGGIVRTPGNPTLHLHGASVDISERKASEEIRRISEEKVHYTNELLTLATNASQLGWGTWDFATGQTSWDSRGREIIGLGEDDNTAEGWLSRLHPDDRPRVETYVQECIAQGHPFDVEYRVVLADENVRWVHGSGAFEVADDGSPIRGTGLIRDITDRKQVEEQLRQAKEEAERLAHAREDFLAHMSHEIRTPLNAVVGLADLLLQQQPQPQQLENLRTLKFSANNLKMLVDDILDFSKIQAGKVAFAEADVQLGELLRSLEKAHQPQAKKQRTQLRFELDERVPVIVRTDALKLSQVMNNLLSNAVKFTSSGIVTVEVSEQRAQDDWHWVTFSVQDTGIGISADQQATIFDAFTQANASTVREYGGTGLGLSITRLLLELMGSQIELESKPGEGSRFYFTLPLRAGTAAGTAPEEAAAPPEALAQLEQLRVLLVEDTAINRMILGQFLQEWWHFRPDEAQNGQEAVDKVQQRQQEGNAYDLILMDIRMPVMDGYQATQAIRELPGDYYQQVPILALTADTLQEIQKHREISLFTDIVTKPFDPVDLRRKIVRHIPSLNAPAPAERTNGKEASAPTASALNLQKVTEAFGGDTATIDTFLQKIVPELVSLRQSFGRAVAGREPDVLKSLIHKSTVLLDLLSLSELRTQLKHTQSLVQNDAPDDELQAAQHASERRLDQVLEQLQQKLAAEGG